MFNTLLYTKKLEDVGIPREQAETHIQIMNEVIESNLATKQDFRELEYRLIIKLGAMLAVSMTVVISVLTFVMKSV